MPITLNGSGTVSGISVGGLPDGIIQSADIASGVIPDGGKILQVKQTKLTTAVSINGVTSYADLTGLNVSITPTSANNKILVMVDIKASTAGEVIFKLVRNSTDVGNSTAGYYTSFHGLFGNTNRSHYYDLQPIQFNFLDDAQDTNAHIYKVQWSNITSVFSCINRTAYHTGVANYSYSGSSSIMAMEVAA